MLESSFLSFELVCVYWHISLYMSLFDCFFNFFKFFKNLDSVESHDRNSGWLDDIPMTITVLFRCYQFGFTPEYTAILTILNKNYFSVTGYCSTSPVM